MADILDIFTNIFISDYSSTGDPSKPALVSVNACVNYLLWFVPGTARSAATKTFA